MPRPNKITNEQILDAAREVFLERGFRATTAEVAQRAGIAEGSLFNRYRTKVVLFQAAMVPTLDDPPWLDHLESSIGQGDLIRILTDAGLEILDFFRGLLPLIMMTWSNAGPSGVPPLLAGPSSPPLRILKRLAAYFEAEMRGGRMSPHHPETVARAYLAGIQNYAFFELITRAEAGRPLADKVYVRGLVELLWRGFKVSEPSLKNEPKTRRKK
jgi:AcrR family transcriptional regulator